MKRSIGCFGRLDQIERIAALGYHSAELDVGELTALSPHEFQDLRARAGDSGLGFEAFSGLIPLSERIHDPAFAWGHWMDHVKRSAERIKAMGGQLIPFGAGKCRSIPAGCADVPGAKARVADFVGEICDILRPYGIRLAVEPLGPANSNYLNFIGEAADFARSLGRENCFIMCDMRHMVKLNEDWQDIVTYQDQIIHAHIDYPMGDLRLFPHNGDGYDYQPYLAALDDAGYAGLITAEATEYQDFSAEAGNFLEMITAL